MISDNLSFNITQVAVSKPGTQLTTIHMIPLPLAITLFIIYLGVHITLGVLKQKEEKIVSDDKEHLDKLKNLKLAFKWWPFIYLILIIVAYV